MDYTGNGATTVYPYTFKIYNASELVVTKLVSGVESTLILNTDYTVSGAGEDAGGNVTLTVALANTIPMVILRVVPVLQSTDIKNQASFFPEVHEDVFDKLVMIAQQHDEELGRGVSLAVSSVGVSAGLPAAEAYKVLGWNSTGTALVNTDTPTTVIPIADSIHAATNKTTPVGADEIGIWNSVSGLLNRLSFTNLAAWISSSVNAFTSSSCTGNAATATLATNATTLAATASTKLPTITATAASSALTIDMSAVYLDFRSATLGDGTVTTILVDPAALVVSSGSTLGTTSAVQSRLAVLVINNAGTGELAVVNMAGGTDLSETGLITTTAEGGAGAADSATVAYSTTARTSVAYRVVGYIESTQATAGTWATDPSTIQPAGGNALTAMSSLGYGQTWQDVTRTAGTTYYNTTGKPIEFRAIFINSNNSATATVSLNGGVGIYIYYMTPGGAYTSWTGIGTIPIPIGTSYVVTVSNCSMLYAQELR